ncbi:MAG: glycosyltransferase [Bacteroidota bacterium]
MNQQPLVSVIIPLYNAANFIEAAIESIYQQNYCPLEIIIVDDGSTDNSATIVKEKYPAVTYVFQKNQGVANARNVGLKLAKGTLIAFLDADDTWRPNMLNTLLCAFQQDAQLDLALGKIQLTVLDKTSGNYSPFKHPFWAASFPAMLVKKSCFFTIGELDESLKDCEDIDWVNRFINSGKKMKLLDFCCLEYRRHGDNMTNANDLLDADLMKMLRGVVRRKRKQQQAPKVSVVLAVKNGEKYLHRAIKSILDQTYKNIEIILIDGHSTDDTKAIAQKCAPDVRYILQANTGIANAYNLGIKKAKGTFITFIGHDDWWEADKIASQIHAFTHNPNVQYVVGRARYRMEGDQPRPTSYKQAIFDNPPMAYMPETLMARKSLFEEVGYFNSAFPIAEDIEWFLQLREQAIPYIALDKVLVHKHIHGENASLQPDLSRQLVLKMMRNSLRRKRAAAQTKIDE